MRETQREENRCNEHCSHRVVYQHILDIVVGTTCREDGTEVNKNSFKGSHDVGTIAQKRKIKMVISMHNNHSY